MTLPRTFRTQGEFDENLLATYTYEPKDELTEEKKYADAIAGYAIGGLSGGEAKDQFWRVVRQCTKYFEEVGPQRDGNVSCGKKPRYCMGVGYIVDMIVCVALGVDMFDCVYPCRT